MKKTYNKKSEKGAISIFVMVAMLFFLASIRGIYLISSKRAQTQTQSLGLTQKIYNTTDAESVYDAKFATGTVPIYTQEQLYAVDTGNQVEIDEKIYTFSAQATYQLQNDIIINLGDDTVPFDESLLTAQEKNGYSIYYYKDNEYYEPAENQAVSNLAVNGRYYKYKNFSGDLGYVTDGLVLHYDGIKNTASGHSQSATTWRDLSGNGNDGTLNGGTWENSDLSFDGVDDSVATIKALNYNSSTAITIQFVDNGEIYNNSQLGMLFESSEDYNFVQGGYYIDIQEFTTNTGICFAVNFNGANLKKVNDLIYNNKNAMYTVICNNAQTYDNFISFYNGITKKNAENVENYNWDITNKIFQNYKFYLGSRAGTNYFTKMKLESIRVYNKALTEQEIAQNYAIDQSRFGIE